MASDADPSTINGVEVTREEAATALAEAFKIMASLGITQAKE